MLYMYIKSPVTIMSGRGKNYPIWKRNKSTVCEAENWLILGSEYVEEEDKGESVYFNFALSIQILSGQKIHQNVMITCKLWGGGGGGGERMTMSRMIHHDQLAVVVRSSGCHISCRKLDSRHSSEIASQILRNSNFVSLDEKNMS